MTALCKSCFYAFTKPGNFQVLTKAQAFYYFMESGLYFGLNFATC